MNNSKNRSFTILSVITLIMLIVVEVLSVLSVSKVGILPTNYLIMLIALMVVVTLIIALLMFIPGKKRKRNAVYTIRRTIGIMLTVVAAVVFLIGTQMLTKLDNTVKDIAAPKTATSKFAVYVMENDSAKEITDAAAYTFAVSDSFDGENLQKAITALQQETSIVPQTVNNETVFEAVDALYTGQVNGMIMSEAYVSVLDDMEDYADFNNKTRILYEIPIVIEQQETTPSVDTPETPALTSSITEPFILYLSGSDTREKTLEVSRSDTNILFVCNPQTKEILLVNTPRDYYVENPAKGNGYDKLTHCGLYGLTNSMQALGTLYGVDVNHYMQINFTGFETLVDAIGGIDITVDETIYTNEGNVLLEPGTTTIDGAHALLFSRLRKTLADGDNDRGRNQMKVIKAIIDKASAANVISNYNDILASLQGMFDTSISYDQIAEFIKLILQDTGTPWNINSYSVTGEGGMNVTASTGSQSLYVTYPDAYAVSSASMLINQVLSGTKLTEADVVPETAIARAKEDPVYGNVEQKTFVNTESTIVKEDDVDENDITYDYNYDNSGNSGSSGYNNYDYNDYDSDSESDYSGGSSSGSSSGSGSESSGYSESDYSGGNEEYSGGSDTGTDTSGGGDDITYSSETSGEGY